MTASPSPAHRRTLVAIGLGVVLTLSPLVVLAYLEPEVARRAGPVFGLTLAVAGAVALGVYAFQRRASVEPEEDD